MAGGVLLSLAPLARMMRAATLARNCKQAWLVFLAFSGGVSWLSIAVRHELYNTAEMPLLANILILGSTLKLLWEFRRRLGNMVPAEPLPGCSVLQEGDETTSA